MFKEISDCVECGEETRHDVSVEIRQEADSFHSREPYRVLVCEKCGCKSESRARSDS